MSGCSSWWVSCFSTTWNSSSFCSSTLCTMSHFINITHLLLTPSSLTSDALKFQSPGLYASLPQDALLQEYSVFIKQTLPQYFSKLFKKRGENYSQCKKLKLMQNIIHLMKSLHCIQRGYSDGDTWWPQVYTEAEWTPCFLWALPEHKQMWNHVCLCSHSEKPNSELPEKYWNLAQA